MADILILYQDGILALCPQMGVSEMALQARNRFVL